MTREDVYKVIDGERAYQDSRWGSTKSSGREGAGERSIDEFILYIAGYANDAQQVASHFGDADEKLAVVRKLAGLCVACMEQHGCPPR